MNTKSCWEGKRQGETQIFEIFRHKTHMKCPGLQHRAPC